MDRHKIPLFVSAFLAAASSAFSSPSLRESALLGGAINQEDRGGPTSPVLARVPTADDIDYNIH